VLLSLLPLQFCKFVVEPTKGKQRTMKKLNKKRGLPVPEPAGLSQSTKEEGDESASDGGPDIALLPDEPLDESLVMEVLKKEAALEAERGGRNFPSKNRTTRRAKAEQVNEAEYLVRTE
jgi:hypothetical protein